MTKGQVEAMSPEEFVAFADEHGWFSWNKTRETFVEKAEPDGVAGREIVTRLILAAHP